MRTVVRQLWVVPATGLGSWAGMLWHQYLTDLGCSLGWTRNGPLTIASTLAVAGGVLAIAYLITRPPRPDRIARARIGRAHTLASASLALTAIVMMLAVSETRVPRGACPVAISDAQPPPIEPPTTGRPRR